MVRRKLRLSEDLRHRTWGFSYCFGRCGLRGGRTEADVSWRTYFLSDTPVSSGISHCQWPLSQERGARESYSRSQAADKSGREEWQRRCLPRVRRRRAGGATTHCDIDDVCLRLNSKHTTATASERSRTTLLKCVAACFCFTARFRTHIQILFKSIQFSSVILHFYWVFLTATHSGLSPRLSLSLQLLSSFSPQLDTAGGRPPESGSVGGSCQWAGFFLAWLLNVYSGWFSWFTLW